MNVRRRGERDGRPVWRLQWSVRDPGTGKRRFEHETFVGSERQAQRRWSAHDAEIRAKGPGYRPASRRLVRDYMADWLRTVELELEPTTFRSYSDLTRLYILPHLGALRLAQLTTPMLQDWISDLRRTGLGGRTISMARGALHVALAHGVRLGVLAHSPVDATRVPRTRGEQRKVDAVPGDEAERIIAAAYARTRYGPPLEFLWLSGLRPSEALGLLWEDVDLEGGVVRIRRSRVKVGGKMLVRESTKTQNGLRDVALPSRAVEALRRRRDQLAADRRAAGDAYRDEGLVFQGRTGGGLRLDTLGQVLRRLLRSLGLPAYRLYDLRHTAASVQLAAGVPLEVVSKRLGHKNISVTADIYGHLLPEANQDAARRVDAFLARSRKPE